MCVRVWSQQQHTDTDFSIKNKYFCAFSLRLLDPENFYYWYFIINLSIVLLYSIITSLCVATNHLVEMNVKESADGILLPIIYVPKHYTIDKYVSLETEEFGGTITIDLVK
jgi:hypothetical protein